MTWLLAAYLFSVSALAMLILTPLMVYLGNRWGIVDRPGPRKIHKTAIPLIGGWAIFATLSLVLWGHLVAALLLRGSPLVISWPVQVQYFIQESPVLVPKILPLYLGAVLMFAVGLVDDIRGMSVKGRLVIQIAIAVILVGIGLRPSLTFLPGWLGAAVGVVWIIGITNAFNFLDGLDGLASGVALVGASALMTIMGMSNQPDVLFLLASLVGTLVGFLRFNWHPAAAFLGSSGSLLLGYLLSVLTIVTTFMQGERDNWLMPLLTPAFILAIPIYDTTSVVLIRLVQKRHIAIGDQSHFHHRLLRLGFTHRQTVVFIVLIAFSVALSGVRLVKATLGQSALVLLQIVGIMSILILAERVAARRHTDFHEKPPPTDLPALSEAHKDRAPQP